MDFFWKASEFRNVYVQRKQFTQLYKLSFTEKDKWITMNLWVIYFIIIVESTVKYSGIQKLRTEYVAHDLMSEES